MSIFKFIKNLSKRAFKVLFFISVLIVVFNLFISFTRDNSGQERQVSGTEYYRQQIYQSIDEAKADPDPVKKIAAAAYQFSVCMFIGEGCSKNAKNEPPAFNKSIMGFVSNMVAVPFANPPASGAYYVYDSFKNAGFIPRAYAAEGVGFASLKPFSEIWKVFRNVTYLILVVILISIGFMIMFRMKLNPQTVISIENSLPKIVISLILITFSFAIAGFLIDMMYILIALSISVLSGNGSTQFFSAAQFQNKYLTANFTVLEQSLFPKDFMILNSINDLSSKIPTPIKFLVPQLFALDALHILPIREMFNLITLGFNLYLILPGIIKAMTYGFGVLASLVFGVGVIMNIFGSSGILTLFNNITGQALTFGGSFGQLPGAAIGLIVVIAVGFLALIVGPPLILGLLILFTVLLLFFRIFFMLLAAYIKILLFIIFAPIFMLFEAIPGRNAFAFWFKNIVAELLTFPITIILLITGYLIVNNLSIGATVGALNRNITTPTFWTPPFLTGINPTAFLFIVGMGIIFSIPTIVKMIKELMGVKGIPGLSLGPGLFFAGGAATTAFRTGILGAPSLLHGLPYAWQQRLRGAPGGIGKLVGGVLGPSSSELYESMGKAAGQAVSSSLGGAGTGTGGAGGAGGGDSTS